MTLKSTILLLTILSISILEIDSAAIEIKPEIKDQQALNETLVTAALRLKDPNEITDLISKGADVNAVVKNRKLETPIISALSNVLGIFTEEQEARIINIIKVLLKEGAKMPAIDHFLAYHIDFSQFGALNLLEKANYEILQEARATASPNIKEIEITSTNNFKKLLMLKLGLRRANEIDDLINKHKILDILIKDGDIDIANEDGSTLLMLAAANGNNDIVNTLLNSGANANASNKDNETALMLAVSSRQVETLNILINAGANLNATDRDGTTALRLAANWESHSEVVNILIRAGANPNIPDEHGTTPLMRSSEGGYVAMVTALLDSGAYVNISDKNGETALIKAIQYSYGKSKETAQEISKALLQAEADPNASDKYGKTALMAAARDGYFETVQALLDAGVDIPKDISKFPKAIQAILEQEKKTRQAILEQEEKTRKERRLPGKRNKHSSAMTQGNGAGAGGAK